MPAFNYDSISFCEQFSTFLIPSGHDKQTDWAYKHSANNCIVLGIEMVLEAKNMTILKA